MAVQQNFAFYKGEDVVLAHTLAVATNITGWAVSFTVRQSQGSPILISKTVGGGITITDPVNGVATIAISSSDTIGLLPGLYLYDIQRTNAGSQTVLTIGQMQLLPEVLN